MALHYDIHGQLTAGPVARRDAPAPGGVGTAWRAAYARRLALTDLGVLVLAVLAAYGARFGVEGAAYASQGRGQTLSYLTIGAVIAIAWWATLALARTRDERIVGEGADEYQRIIRSTVLVFGLVSMVSVAFKVDLSRGYLAVAFPLGTVGLVAGRRAWRSWLQRERRHGRLISQVLVVGGARSAQHVAERLGADRRAGYRVTGVWVPDRLDPVDDWLDLDDELVPVMGTHHTVVEALERAEADTVVVTDTEHLGPTGLNELTWQLESMGAELMVAPNVLDVASTRLHLKSVADMPLIHLEEPTYSGATKWQKVLFDRVFAAGSLLMLAPLLLGVALAVKLDSRGPVFYRSTRVGINGQPFGMLKFRSMVVDADQRLAQLAAVNEGAGVLFKMKDDPRVTRVGGFIRRFSLDELPQLWNVLVGDMSMVGPRPPLPSEVAQYTGHTDRRLLVRQGITGLWQVSGRSDLSWEESVRLDLDYVENWSLTRDIVIIWRTVRAVLKSNGAY